MIVSSGSSEAQLPTIKPNTAIRQVHMATPILGKPFFVVLDFRFIGHPR